MNSYLQFEVISVCFLNTFVLEFLQACVFKSKMVMTENAITI